MAQIISVSRRTDIPAHYCDWFFARVREGYTMVRNPFRPTDLSRVSLLREDVTCFVFWTKWLGPFTERMLFFQEHPSCVLHTLNAYERDIEPNMPPLDQRVRAFQRMAAGIGPRFVRWRYDPILLNENYTPEWHLERFAHLAAQLEDYTDTCIISFLDMYASIKRPMAELGVKLPETQQMLDIAGAMNRIAIRHGMRVTACAESEMMAQVGIGRSSCIDPFWIADRLGEPVRLTKDKGQRPGCHCMPSVDIGEYDTCPFACAYCYANHDMKRVELRQMLFRPDQRMLGLHLSTRDGVRLHRAGTHGKDTER